MAIAAFILMSTATAACSRGDDAAVQVGTYAVASVDPSAGALIDFGYSPNSAEDQARNSTSIALLTPTGKHGMIKIGADSFEMRSSQFRLVEKIAGEDLAPEITVASLKLQFPTEDGVEYLVFLSRGTEAGEWYSIAGEAAGVYVRDRDAYRSISLEMTTPVSDSTLEELKALVGKDWIPPYEAEPVPPVFDSQAARAAIAKINKACADHREALSVAPQTTGTQSVAALRKLNGALKPFVASVRDVARSDDEKVGLRLLVDGIATVDALGATDAANGPYRDALIALSTGAQAIGASDCSYLVDVAAELPAR